MRLTMHLIAYTLPPVFFEAPLTCIYTLFLRLICTHLSSNQAVYTPFSRPQCMCGFPRVWMCVHLPQTGVYIHLFPDRDVSTLSAGLGIYTPFLESGCMYGFPRSGAYLRLFSDWGVCTTFLGLERVYGFPRSDATFSLFRVCFSAAARRYAVLLT